MGQLEGTSLNSVTISELSVLSLNTLANEEIASLSSDLLTEDDFAKVDTAVQNALASIQVSARRPLPQMKLLSWM